MHVHTVGRSFVGRGVLRDFLGCLTSSAGYHFEVRFSLFFALPAVLLSGWTDILGSGMKEDGDADLAKLPTRPKSSHHWALGIYPKVWRESRAHPVHQINLPALLYLKKVSPQWKDGNPGTLDDRSARHPFYQAITTTIHALEGCRTLIIIVQVDMLKRQLTSRDRNIYSVAIHQSDTIVISRRFFGEGDTEERKTSSKNLARNRMGRKKKREREDAAKALQNPSKDIDEIFAEKSPSKAAEKTTSTAIQASTKPSTQSVGKSKGDDLATIQRKIKVAKTKELPSAVEVVPDDDFADIRGTKKRTYPPLLSR
jgi:hypothetical protein